MIESMTTGSEMTTIKVPVALRDRLRALAEEQQVTQAEALERLLDEASDPRIEQYVSSAFDRWAPALEQLA